MPETIPQKVFEKQKRGHSTDSASRASFAYLVTEAIIMVIFVVLFRLSFILCALVAQLMTCFRRDWINTNFTTVLIHNAPEEKLSCNDKVEVVTGLFIPDIVIILLAFWVYYGLKFGGRYCCGWKELKAVMRADTADSLNILVQAARDKLTKSHITITYTIIPVVYIILSLLVSVIYLIVFKLAYKNVVIQPPLGGITLGGDIKYGTIVLSFIGFIALDLLYLRVMLRYAYRCQLIIYCLKILKKKVKIHKKDQERRNNENQERQGDQEVEINVDEEVEINEVQNQHLKNDLVKDTEAIHTFIEDLNVSSGTTALLIILAGFQAVNCAINLLSACEISYGQAAAVSARLLLWGFLLVFPFRKAAGVNIVSKRLQDLGWDVKRKSVAHDGDSGPITLTANMFSISVNPWLPFLVTMVLLFTIMAGAKIKWYQLKM